MHGPEASASERQDGLCQLSVAGLQGWGLLANVGESALQFRAADVTVAGNEAGGVVTGGLDDLVVTERGRHIGGGISGGGDATNDGIGGDDKAGGVGSGSQGQQQRGAKQA
ncbi:protein of unknown function [Pseudomonas sp. JV241A]|nr:protein of unknown function [Pseudomonas sp. JV241A]